MSSLKKVFLKVLQYTQENTCAGISFKQSCRSAAHSIKKETLVQICLCEFCKVFKRHFFKYIPGQLLLEEHWISLKMTPIAIAVNVSNASYLRFILVSFFRSAYNKFVEISIEAFVKVFLLCEFFLLSKFFNGCKETNF